MAEQNQNKRVSRMLTYKGETKCLLDWSRITGVSRQSIDRRLSAGWSIEETLTTPKYWQHPLQSQETFIPEVSK